MRRRDFITHFGIGAGALLTTGIASCQAGQSDATKQVAESGESSQTKVEPKVGLIKKYNAISGTDLRMSDISMGCGALDNPYVIERAIDVGINYFDTAPDYGNGSSESTLGKVLAKPSKRQKAIVASKICEKGRYGVHLDVGVPETQVIRAVEGTLERIKSDYVDIMLVHAIGERSGDEKRLLDSNMLSAATKLKEQGKIRYLGVSSHGPNNFADLLNIAIESGHFAMIMTAFNFMEFPRLTEVLANAKKHDVGVVAMKTLAGAKGEDLSKFRTGETSLAEAAFKWVFTHPEVNGLVVTMKNTAQVDEYAAASGKRFSSVDREVLDTYAKSVWSSYCRTGCGECQSRCPHEVSIPEILRLSMYFDSYGEHLKALREYRQLPTMRRPYACAECDGPCTAGCQFNLPVRERLMQASRNLELA